MARRSFAEREALIDDIWTVGLLGVGLIRASILLYFRFGAALLHIALSVGSGAARAFAVAWLVYGHRNAATSLLVSIIVGNGINHSIMYLGRYREQRAVGACLEDALAEAAVTVRNGTWVAALAAAGAFGCLLVTSFRGFSGFGLIGGFGMISCWVTTFLVLPASVSAVEHLRWRRAGNATASTPIQGTTSLTAGFAVWATRRAARTLLVIAAAMAVFAVFYLPEYLRDPWEHNSSRLTSKSSKQAGAGAWGDKSREITGVRRSPVLLLVDHPAQALAVTVVFGTIVLAVLSSTRPTSSSGYEPSRGTSRPAYGRPATRSSSAA